MASHAESHSRGSARNQSRLRLEGGQAHRANPPSRADDNPQSQRDRLEREYFSRNRNQILQHFQADFEQFCHNNTGNHHRQQHDGSEDSVHQGSRAPSPRRHQSNHTGRRSHRTPSSPRRVQSKRADHTPPPPPSRTRSRRLSPRPVGYPKDNPQASRIHTPIKIDPNLAKEMDALLGPASGTDNPSPFIPAIRDYLYPSYFKIPEKLPKYDGTSDPRDYIHKYKAAMDLPHVTDEIKCRLFSRNFEGKARQWFDDLPRGSISNFRELATSFVGRFFQLKKFTKSSADLMNIRQGKGETLMEFAARFSEESLQVENRTDQLVIAAFLNGLNPGTFYSKLVREAPDTVAQLMSLVESEAKGEEANRKKRDGDSHPRKDDDKAKGDSRTKPGVFDRLNFNKGRLEPRVNDRSLTPLTKTRTEILTVHRDVLRQPPAINSPAYKRNRNLFCAYHNDHGHDTESCNDLKKEIEDCLKNGMLRQYVAQGQGQNQRSRWKPRNGGNNQGGRNQGQGHNSGYRGNAPYVPYHQPQQLPAPHSGANPGDNRAINGVIQTIFGLPEGTSKSALKAQARRIPPQEPVHKRFRPDETITFSEVDAVPPISPHTDALVIQAIVANKEVHRVHIDQGSAVDILYVGCFRQLGISEDRLQPTTLPLTGFTSELVRPLGTITLAVTVGDYPKDRTLMTTFYVIDSLSPFNIILGRPWINGAKAVPSTYHLCVKFPTNQGIATVRGNQNVAKECMRIAFCPNSDSHTSKGVNSILVEGQDKANLPYQSEDYPEITDDTEAVVLNPEFPEQVIQVGTTLPLAIKDQLISLLRQYCKVFAWKTEDMPGVSPSLIVHRLNIDARIKPVQQKKRSFAPERRQAIIEEVRQLCATGILAEVLYPTWLANPVMVKKPDNSWRMCVDYTDLNKYCPKDCYPLPAIDQKVEAISGHEVLMFLDAYKGYHQILMAEEDAEKTAFITDIGAFCYKKMPFGLKNAGATYQRMMDRVFAHQIGRNLEVYVDDMVIKCKTASDAPKELEETLQTLLSVDLRLNPKKCIFGVGSGKFLGYMVSKRGIEANPKKLQAIIQMQPPGNIKDVQRLTGCLAALSRFLSRSADRSFPFFKLLKNMETFQWTPECQRAFDDLKNYLQQLPAISVPIAGEILYLYLAVSANAISGVLVRENESQQKPVYFVSRALHGPEIRYTDLEKLVLALVHTSRRLKPYFQGHPICVLTNHNLRGILRKPDASGRLMKWAVELGEHDIEYRSRTAIKGQALADFLVEMHENSTINTSSSTSPTSTPTASTSQDAWSLYVDGASNEEGSGAGLLFTSPTGEELPYALRFGFFATNNEAEYEAVITGLQLATRLRVHKLTVYSDSQIVVNHINGQYEVRDPQLKKYLAQVQELSKPFEQLEVRHIPRTQNKMADALSKLASSSFASLNKQILVELVPHRAIENKEILAIGEVEDTWMTPIIQYLETGQLPSDRNEARRLQLRASQYVLQDGILYRRAYLQPLQRCVGPSQADYIMREMHYGSCGSHAGTRALMKKILHWGYYWPTLAQDVHEFIQRCDQCQRNASITRQPQAPLVTMQSPWPFAQWGIDLLGPFPEAPGRVKWLVVAIDYFSKWVEAKPLATITGRHILNFVWQNIVCRYGIPHTIVSDNGTQFAENPFKAWCTELNIQQRFTSVAHPQANGQVEVTNRTILQGLKTRLGAAAGDWVDNLSNILWAYRTTPRTSTGETPYSLVYGMEAVIPAEIGVPSPRLVNFLASGNEAELRCNLDLLDEKRDCSRIQQAKYKEAMAKYYNDRVHARQFKPGDMVLRKNEASKALPLGKLTPNWEGPYIVVSANTSGSYMLKTVAGKMLPRPWHISNLRRYYL